MKSKGEDGHGFLPDITKYDSSKCCKAGVGEARARGGLKESPNSESGTTLMAWIAFSKLCQFIMCSQHLLNTTQVPGIMDRAGNTSRPALIPVELVVWGRWFNSELQVR